MKFWRTWRIQRLKARLAKARLREKEIRVGETTREMSRQMTANTMLCLRLQYEIGRLQGTVASEPPDGTQPIPEDLFIPGADTHKMYAKKGRK